VSQHTACPFGAVASVHAWERVGAAIAHVARKYLKISVLRYVDDYFAPERCRVVSTLVMSRCRLSLWQGIDHGAFFTMLGPTHSHLAGIRSCGGQEA